MAFVTLSWTPNPATDNVKYYEVWGANGTSVAFGSCSLLATVAGTTWTDSGLPPNQPRTYYIVAVNAAGSASPEGPINITTAAGAAITLIAAANLSAGQIVNIFSSGGAAKVQPADVADDTKGADGFVSSAVTSGNPATVYVRGATIAGLLSLTPGATYWLAASGAITATEPSSGWNQVVGKALSATTLLFDPQQGDLL